MHSSRRAFVAGGLVAFTVACSGPDEVGTPRATATVEQDLEASLVNDEDTANVIVNLRPPPSNASFAERRAHHRRLADGIVDAYGDGFTASRRFIHVPAIAGTITKRALDRLRHDPNVTYVQVDGTGSGQLKEAVPAIGGDKVKSMLGITGRGVRVAVLDTGVVTNHPDLKSSIVAQHCFTQFDCPPLRSNEGMSAEDDHGHGSNVAGIITSDGVVAPPGFAPDAEIVAVKVDNQNDAGQISDWVAGLDWVYDNLSMLKVQVINMSICSTQLFSDAASCDLGEPAIAAAVKNLVDAGVVIFSASGNNGSSTQTSAPACNTGVIAVGAVYDSNVGHQPPNAATYAALAGASFANCGDNTTAFDQVTCFTNSNKRLDIVAPGAPMLSDSLNNSTETYWGTSQASPVGAAVAALMLQCNPKLTPAQVKAAMTSTGVPRMDPKNGLMFPSIRAFDVVKSVCSNLGGAGGVGGAAGAAGSAGAGGVTGSGGMSAGAGGTIATSGGAGNGVSGGTGSGIAGAPTSAGGVPAGSGGGVGVAGAVGAGGAAGGAPGSLSGAGPGGAAGLGNGAGPTESTTVSCHCAVPGSARERPSRGWFPALAAAIALLRRRRHVARRS